MVDGRPLSDLDFHRDANLGGVILVHAKACAPEQGERVRTRLRMDAGCKRSVVAEKRTIVVDERNADVRDTEYVVRSLQRPRKSPYEPAELQLLDLQAHSVANIEDHTIRGDEWCFRPIELRRVGRRCRIPSFDEANRVSSLGSDRQLDREGFRVEATMHYVGRPRPPTHPPGPASSCLQAVARRHRAYVLVASPTRTRPQTGRQMSQFPLA